MFKASYKRKIFKPVIFRLKSTESLRNSGKTVHGIQEKIPVQRSGQLFLAYFEADKLSHKCFFYLILMYVDCDN
jgi:hypothetical protein